MVEWVSLKSTLHTIKESRFDCGTCLSKHLGRPDYEVVTKQQREDNGCWGGEVKRHTILEAGRRLNFTTCIGNWASDAWEPWMAMQSEYARHGTLPFRGSFTEQPAKVIEIFRVIESFQAAQEKERMRKQQKSVQQQKKGNRVGR